MVSSGRSHVVDGVRIYVQSAGHGEPLLLIHGWLFSHRSWRAVLPPLSAQFSVYAPDLPGHGESDRPASYPYSLDALAGTLAGLLDSLELPRVSLIGHSLGGSLALLLAARHRQRVGRLVLVSPLIQPAPLPVPLRLALLPVLGERFFKRLCSRRALREFLRQHIYLDPALPTDEQLHIVWERLSRPGGSQAAYRILQSLTEHGDALVRAMPEVSCPVLMVRGDRDRLLPEAHVDRLRAGIAAAELVRIAGAAHAAHEERPDAFVEAVLAFLRAA
jgi:pimeloyl-ACP methyl ester carboxylesterase